MAPSHALTFALLLSCSLIILNFCCVPVHALNLGIQQLTDVSTPDDLNKGHCTRKCQSKFCTVAPILRYGKYCGLLFGGCPGEKPCDGLDACCMQHDSCVEAHQHQFLSTECSQNLLNCMQNFKNSGGKGFKGSHCELDDVLRVLTKTIKVALATGRRLHIP
ncbi:hypothetical protein FH972_016181 [Carpinus fangiana]|uniref:phospholipase A2 n=1 Tax=Carpinus fangiana TaxID=176857 RepID=A0A5N6RG77_9ROSI|nr:hypothetical protein FH972_016181 [Carpinus fangiana]